MTCIQPGLIRPLLILRLYRNDLKMSQDKNVIMIDLGLSN